MGLFHHQITHTSVYRRVCMYVSLDTVDLLSYKCTANNFDNNQSLIRKKLSLLKDGLFEDG